jgi:hypothetical protein
VGSGEIFDVGKNRKKHLDCPINPVQSPPYLSAVKFWSLDLLALNKQASEPEFLNILKCNLAESASAGFQFNCYDIFNDKTLVITGICTTFQIC